MKLVIVYFIFTAILSSHLIAKANEKNYFKTGLTDHSILFVRLHDQKVLLDSQANKLLSPASVTKILTAAAALDFFSPEHQFETKFYHTGKKINGQISGNIYIKGEGDPLIVNEKLWEMAADIKHMGIRSFAGSLNLDMSLFDKENRDALRKNAARRSAHAYDAPITPLGVNFNSYTVFAYPGQQENKKALLSLYPYSLDHVLLKNRVSTAKKSKKSKKIRVTRESSNGKSLLTARGKMKPGSELQKIYRSVGNPVLASGETIRTFLKKEGIQIKGRTRMAAIPQNATLFYTLRGYPLNRIIHGLNKYSNNYIADVLVKKIGAQFTNQAGSFHGGLEGIHHFLTKKVGLKSGFVLKNGSGLHSENLLSARHVVDVLVYMSQRFDLFPEFLNSLPSSGRPGTLKKRMRIKTGWIRGKTGTLTRPIVVSTIAGYFWHPKHQLVAFAVLGNGRTQGKQPNLLNLRKFQDDALLQVLSEI